MISSETFYLGCGAEQVSVVVDHPASAARRETGVLISPPFGWPEVASYRIRRRWAAELAERGHLTMRLTLPSTGDSDGTPRDAARFAAWSRALTTGAAWLRERAGVRRVAVIGLELGGLLALNALAEGASIDDVVLWAAAGRGRTFVRELRAFSRFESEQFHTDGEPPAPPPGELHAGGFLLSAETVASLEQFDVERLPADHGPQRALLLERDGIAPDAAVRRYLESAGTALTTAPGDGYATMTNHPQQARVPSSVVQRVAAWLADGERPVATSPPGRPPTAADQLSEATITPGDGAIVRERPFALAQPFGDVSGVIAEPSGQYAPGLGIVMLNAGAIRRIGPGRMWVEIARRWASRGVPVLRLDLQGIGDADGDADYSHDRGLYVPEFVAQVLAALDALEQSGVANAFLLSGLCSGAYWSFHAALRDSRVVAASLLNPRALFWNESVMPSRDLKRLARSRSDWHKISQVPRSRYWGLARWVAAAPARGVARGAARAVGRREPDEVIRALDSLRGARKPLMLLFSEQEPLHEELTKSGHIEQLHRWPNVSLELIDGRDHTLRPSVSQSQAHAAFDRSVQRALASGGAGERLAPISSQR